MSDGAQLGYDAATSLGAVVDPQEAKRSERASFSRRDVAILGGDPSL